MTSEGLRRVMREVWGYDSFRGPQRDAMRATLSGDDVIVVMATGGGKSLCYQVPALVAGRPAIVISPLISLMEDQVRALEARGVGACLLGSAQQDGGVKDRAWAGDVALVYMTPEMALASVDRIAALHGAVAGGLSLVAVDEAHCISEWGHDYRREYMRLGELRPLLPSVPFVAVTATATLRVMREIRDGLRMGGSPDRAGVRVFCTSFDRPNLRFEVVQRPAGKAATLRSLVSACARATADPGGGGAIVYALTRKHVDELCDQLTRAFGGGNGVRCEVFRYHASMEGAERSASHDGFMRSSRAIMVATVAYGMGINKPDVRAVLHLGAPGSLETYYQQAGRAGRDGRPALCRLYWSYADISMLDFVRAIDAQGTSVERLAALGDATTSMQAYCHTSACRAATISNHFRVTGDDNATGSQRRCEGTCDNCDRGGGAAPAVDVSAEARMVLSAIEGGRCSSLCKAVEDMSPSRSREWWRALAGRLVALGFIRYCLRHTAARAMTSPRLTKRGQLFLSVSGSGSGPLLVSALPD